MAHLSTIVSWIADPPDDHHAEAARALADTWLKDSFLGEAVARTPWVMDGIEEVETLALSYASNVAGSDPRASPLIPWYSYYRVSAPNARVLYIDILAFIAAEARKDPTAAQALPAFYQTGDIVLEDHEIARGLGNVARHADIQSMLPVAEFANGHTGDLARHLLEAMSTHATNQTEDFGRLTDMEWYIDGLTAQEAAAMVAITAVGSTFGSQELYRSFLDNHYVQSKTVSLPLAGQANIWVIQNAPFPPGGYQASVIEDAVLSMESFIGVPFPTSDIILIVAVPGPDDDLSYRGAANVRDYIYAARTALSALPQELAHYYDAGPQWLKEGGAEFIRNHLRNQGGGLSLGERLEASSKSVASGCIATDGIENLFHYERHSFFFPYGCANSMGEHFLLAVAEAIGEGQTASALGALYLRDQELRAEDGRLAGQVLYDTFLTHIPPDRRDAFIEVYRRLHGGPTLPDIPDDHGDSVRSATMASLGEPVHGTLDYRFDLDYFRFPAEEGRTYRIDVEHSALRETSVWGYDGRGYGLTSFDVRDGAWRTEPGASGPRAFWITPEADDYYAVVENFAGESGPYTLTITLEE